jgi:hypothetical protein
MSSPASECEYCAASVDMEHSDTCPLAGNSICGISYDHPAREDDPTCPECDADLSDWWADCDD